MTTLGVEEGLKGDSQKGKAPTIEGLAVHGRGEHHVVKRDGLV